jgi:galactose mutarotase-like enzyme
MKSTLDRFHCIICFLISGRIKAAQLEYSDAHKHLLQALRKAPTHGAVGFKQTAMTNLDMDFTNDTLSL